LDKSGAWGISPRLCHDRAHTTYQWTNGFGAADFSDRLKAPSNAGKKKLGNNARTQ
jgi:hypothetical protein